MFDEANGSTPAPGPARCRSTPLYLPSSCPSRQPTSGSERAGQTRKDDKPRRLLQLAPVARPWITTAHAAFDPFDNPFLQLRTLDNLPTRKASKRGASWMEKHEKENSGKGRNRPLPEQRGICLAARRLQIGIRLRRGASARSGSIARSGFAVAGDKAT